MIPFADLAPGPVEIGGSFLFLAAIALPVFAVFVFIFGRLFQGPAFEHVEDDVDINIALTPLHQAVIEGSWETIAPLLAEGTDIHEPVGEGVFEVGATPLHLAAGAGHAEVVSLLIERGAEPNRLDIRGRTPLHYAAERAEASAIGTLLAAGANADLIDEHGATALMLAKETGQGEAIGLLERRG